MSDDIKKNRKELMPVDMSPIRSVVKDNVEVGFDDPDPKGLADNDAIDAVKAS